MIWSAMTLLSDLGQVIEPFIFLPGSMKRLSCLISNVPVNGNILLFLVFCQLTGPYAFKLWWAQMSLSDDSSMKTQLLGVSVGRTASSCRELPCQGPSPFWGSVHG